MSGKAQERKVGKNGGAGAVPDEAAPVPMLEDELEAVTSETSEVLPPVGYGTIV